MRDLKFIDKKFLTISHESFLLLLFNCSNSFPRNKASFASQDVLTFMLMVTSHLIFHAAF